MQDKFNQRLEREANDQKELRDLIESLERQISEKDAVQADKENGLRIQEDKLASERRKFQSEKDIFFAKVELEKNRLQVGAESISEFIIGGPKSNGAAVYCKRDW